MSVGERGVWEREGVGEGVGDRERMGVGEKERA